MNPDEYVCMLFDLMLYRYPELSKRVFQLIVLYFTRLSNMLETLTRIQMLENSRSKGMTKDILET